MKYEAPEMEIVAIGADTAIAVDENHEIGVGAGSLLSKIPQA